MDQAAIGGKSTLPWLPGLFTLIGVMQLCSSFNFFSLKKLRVVGCVITCYTIVTDRRAGDEERALTTPLF